MVQMNAAFPEDSGHTSWSRPSADTYATNDWNTAVSFKQLAHRVLNFIVGNGNDKKCFHVSVFDAQTEFSRFCSSRQLSGFIDEKNKNTANSDNAV